MFACHAKFGGVIFLLGWNTVIAQVDFYAHQIFYFPSHRASDLETFRF